MGMFVNISLVNASRPLPFCVDLWCAYELRGAGQNVYVPTHLMEVMEERSVFVTVGSTQFDGLIQAATTLQFCQVGM